MSTPTLERIEADIEQLSLTEQRLLMDRLAHRLRNRSHRSPVLEESDLIAMANDPAIQRESRQIDAEFASTEADGLDATP